MNVAEHKTMRLKYTFSLTIITGLLGLLLAGCQTGQHEDKEDQAKLMSQAKIAKVDAEKIALGQVPGGTIKEGELEQEKGKLIWSFDIATPGTKDITEVNVDALTGKVIAVEKETPAAQAKEKKKDKEGEEKEDKK